MNNKERDDQIRRQRLLWRCRRGTFELDTLLHNFVAHQYANFSKTELDSLDDLLERPHADLVRWFVMGEQSNDASIAAILRKFHDYQSSTLNDKNSD